MGGRRGLFHLCHQSPFVDVLRATDLWCGVVNIDKLPCGAIVAVCELAGCYPTGTTSEGSEAYLKDGEAIPIWGVERSFGDYSIGRYAWLLADIRALPEPVPVRGQLGLWTPDAATLAAVERQLEEDEPRDFVAEQYVRLLNRQPEDPPWEH